MDESPSPSQSSPQERPKRNRKSIEIIEDNIEVIEDDQEKPTSRRPRRSTAQYTSPFEAAKGKKKKSAGEYDSDDQVDIEKEFGILPSMTASLSAASRAMSARFPQSPSSPSSSSASSSFAFDAPAPVSASPSSAPPPLPQSFQLSQQPSSQFVAPSPIVPGTIEEMTLVNFMCHGNFTIKFHPHINFIVGTNGSGKSAVLTALQVGLGGKATSTSRGSTFRDLIKTGESQAIITIKLRNQGIDAYKPKVYGPSITIERRIIAPSSTAYRIIADDGTVVSTKAGEVHEMLFRLNISMDNPCAVLTQEKAKSFLGGSSPTEKYNFFMNGTLLLPIQHEIDAATEKLARMERKLLYKEAELERANLEYTKWKARRVAAARLRVLDGELVDAKKDLVWAAIHKEELKHEALVKKVNEKEAMREKLEAKVARMADDYQARDDMTKKIKDDLTRLEQLVRDLTEEEEVSREAYKEMKIVMDAVDGDLKDLDGDIRRRMEEIEKLQKKIEGVTRKNSEAENAKRLKDLEEAKDKLQKNLETERNALKRKEDQEAILSTAESDARDLEVLVADAAKEQREIEQQIDLLQAPRKDRFAQYGMNMLRLVQSIQMNIGRFSKPPIGPIGLLLDLTRPEWSKAVSVGLKNYLTSFIVDNLRDADVLQELAKHANIMNISRIVSKYQRALYQIDQQRATFLSIDQVLQLDRDSAETYPIKYMEMCKDELWPTIFNALVDQTSMEHTILIEHIDDANQIMFRTPYHLTRASKCYLPDGACLHSQGSSQMTHTAGDWRGLQFGSSVETQIREARMHYDNKGRELAAYQAQLASAKKAKIEATGSLKSVAAILRGAQKSLYTLQERIRDLEVPVEVEVQEVISLEAIDEWTEEIKHIREQVHELSAQREVKLREREKKMEEFAPKANRRQEVQDEFKRVREQQDSKGASLVELINIMGSIQHQQKEAQKLLDGMDDKIEPLVQDAKALKKKIDAQIAAVTEMEGDRPARQVKTQAQLLALVKKLEQEKRQQSLLVGDGAEITAADALKRFQEVEKIYLKNLSQLNSLKGLKLQLEAMLTDRKKWMKSMLQKDICATARQSFLQFMLSRGHSGALNIVHEDKSLTIKVAFESNGARKVNRSSLVEDITTLSGGEKSFTTLCFLMSLWQLIESPFRILDEFDVFMDDRYRHISTQNLIDAAKEPTLRHRQYILITPSALKMDKIKDLGVEKVDYFFLNLKPARQSGQLQVDEMLQNPPPAE